MRNAFSADVPIWEHGLRWRQKDQGLLRVLKKPLEKLEPAGAEEMEAMLERDVNPASGWNWLRTSNRRVTAG
jgi:hypothetical protein